MDDLPEDVTAPPAGADLAARVAAPDRQTLNSFSRARSSSVTSIRRTA